MIYEGIEVNEDIINIYDDPLIEHVTEGIIDEGLEN